MLNLLIELSLVEVDTYIHTRLLKFAEIILCLCQSVTITNGHLITKLFSFKNIVWKLITYRTMSMNRASERARAGNQVSGRPWAKVDTASAGIQQQAAFKSSRPQYARVEWSNVETEGNRGAEPTDMDRIFRGIMKYRRTNRTKMVEQFVQVKNNPQVSSKDNDFERRRSLLSL